jgi:hypothetical protein
MLPWSHAVGMGWDGENKEMTYGGWVGGPKVKEFGGSRVSWSNVGEFGRKVEPYGVSGLRFQL